MSKIIEQIADDIRLAPSTFINIAFTGDSPREVYGPHVLGEQDAIPRYGFTDEVISAVESGDYKQVIHGNNSHFCGSVFSMTPGIQDAKKTLPLMMRLARAGLITPTNYSEGRDLDAWSATPEAGREMRALVLEMGMAPFQVESNIKSSLDPDSAVEAGRKLCDRINENYK